jgi:hypothetical protein
MPARVRITLAAAVALAVLVAAGAYAAPSNVPQITKISASPKSFCAKASGSCSSTGTTIRFTMTTAARVIADIRPRSHNVWGHREFERKFPAGANKFRLDDSRLTTGRWTLRLQGVNSLGAGPPSFIDVHVIK